MQLFDDQLEVLEKVRQAFQEGHRAVLLYAPTGAGKTECAISMLEATAKNFKRSAMVLDRIVLVNQTSERLQKYSIDHGVLQSGHWRHRPYERIQVCSAQTLEKRGSFPGLNLGIIDECHTQRKQTTEFIRNNPNIRFIGLSASPFAGGLSKTYTKVVSATTTEKLVEKKRLVPLRVFIAKEIDMAGAKKVAGEWSQGDAAERGMKITGDVVAEWVKKTTEIYGGPKKTIVFCSNVAHGADLAQKFAEAGYNFVAISYKDSDEFKVDAVADFSKPDTKIHGLIACDILTKGFDVSDVCIGVSARPFTKSFSSHVQQMGRVMRAHEDKQFALWLDHCIAGNQRVLTHRGLVRIDRILLSDKIWDGNDFVSHKGVISRGTRPVIEYAGLTATADHLVFTREEGWCSLGYCADKQKAIVTTGIGGTALRQCDDYFTGCSVAWVAASAIHACSLRVRHLWLSVNNCVGEFAGRRNKRMSPLQPAKTSAGVAECKGGSNARKVQEQEQCTVRKLWWQGNPIQIRFSDFLRSLDSRELGIIGCTQGAGVGSHRQQWELRAREHSLSHKTGESQQHEKNKVRPIDAQIHDRKPGYSIRGMYASAASFCRTFFRGNSHPISQKKQQAEREVWDILDCGPRNSFTCEGLLVHNSGNYLRFQEDWDDLYANGVLELKDDKEKPKKEKTELEKKQAKCPACGALWIGRSDNCVSCGYHRPMQSLVQAVPGEMEEIKGAAKKEDKQRWYSELLDMRGTKSSGWVAHKYKEKFGVWPQGLNDVAIPASLEVRRWVTSRQIAWAKSKKAA